MLIKVLSCLLYFYSLAPLYGDASWAAGVEVEKEDDVEVGSLPTSTPLPTPVSPPAEQSPLPKSNLFDTDGSSEEWSVLQKAFLFAVILAAVGVWVKVSKRRSAKLGEALYEKEKTMA